MRLQRPISATHGFTIRDGSDGGGGRTAWSKTSRSLAATTAMLMALGGSLLFASSAQAAPAVSTSQGSFLSGSALALNLSTLANLVPANATNTGAATVTDAHPLDVTALQAVTVDLGSGINLLGSNGILTLGAVNQFAQSRADGSSVSATGAVTNNGGIAIGGAGAPPANASLNLTSLTGTNALSNLRVNVGALASTATQAVGAGGAQSGTYQISGLNLALTSPALGATVSGLRTTLSGLQPTVNGIQTTLNGLLLGAVTVNNLPTVANVVDSLTSVTSADGSITANLQTGAITVNVATLLAAQGLNINNLPMNTDLTPYITTALTTQLLPALTTALTGLVTQLTTSLNGVSATLLGQPVSLAVLQPVLNGVITTVVAPVNTVVSGLGANVVTPLATALTNVVSLQANVKETAGGVFTERALRLRVVPAGPTAVVNLASSSVGPNAGPAAMLPPATTAITPTAGPTAGGTAVTLTGTDFAPGSTVSIGGTTVTPTAIALDGTSLTFTTPAHAAGAVPVTVTSTAGTSGPQTFTYLAAPTSTGLTPTLGPIAGGTAVTVTGTGFAPGSTVSIGGTTVTPTTIASGGTSLTFTTPAHAAGTVPVTVTSPGGTSDPLNFTYVPAPATTGINPAQGPIAGGTPVTIAGSGFLPGSTVSLNGGAPITPTTISADGTTVTFTTPAHPAGATVVQVSNPGGVSNAQTFTFLGAPASAGLTPNQGPVTGGTPVTVTGANFAPGSTVSVGGGAPITPTAISPDGTSLTFTTLPHAAGAAGVTVTTAGGVTAPQTFTFLATPTSTGIAPLSGPVAGGTPVTVTGTGFVNGSTVSIDGGAAITPTFVAADGSNLSFVTPAHVAGPVAVTVTNPGGTTGPQTFTFLAVPTTTGLTPTQGPVTGGTAVTVRGAGFVPGSTVSLDGGAPITPTAVAVDGTSVTFTTPTHVVGGTAVTVTNPGGISNPQTFTYLAAPTTSGLDPIVGPIAGGTPVTVTGTGFVPGSTVSIDGVQVAPTTIAPNGTTVTFTTPVHIAGDVQVTVASPGGISNPQTFSYVGVPTATGIAPVSGPTIGGTPVTITGTGFIAGSTVSLDGGAPITPTAIAVDGTTVTFATPAHVAGPVQVTVTNAGGTTAAQTFTFVAAPTTTGITPAEGPIAGGTPVTVTGTGFIPGSTVSIDGGTPITPTIISDDGTALTFTTPPHTAGDVSVMVSNPGGTSNPQTFAFDALPTATGISPLNGPTIGGTPVTVTGTGFTAGSTVSIDGGAAITPTDVAPDGTTVTLTTPAHAFGPVDVTVTTAGGTTGPQTFTYVAPVGPVPTTTAIDPNHGPAAGGTPVTITGTGFTAGSTISVAGGPAFAPTDVAPGGTSVTFVSPEHAAGEVGITVTTPGGTSNAQQFTYDALPVSTGIDPVVGPVTGDTAVTITGTGFVAGATVSIDDGAAITPTAIALDGTSVTFRTPIHEAGPVDVTVTTVGGTTAAQTFTFVDAPTTTGIDPAVGPSAGGTPVTVTGTGFLPGSTVSVDGRAPIIPTTIDPSGTSLTFSTPAHVVGDADVTVTNAGGTSGAQTFTYVAVPTTTGIDPTSGPVTGGTSVSLTGTGFLLDSTVSLDGGAAITPSFVSDDGTSLSFQSPMHVAGDTSVTVTNVGGTSGPQTFTFLAAPTTSTIDPAQGPTTGGTGVTITGTGFVAGSTVSVGGGDPIAPLTVSDDGTSLTFSTPAHDAGVVDVTVTNPGGESNAQQFTYAAAPTATAIDPAQGPSSGGTSVTITGTGFVPGSTTVSVDGGDPITPTNVSDDGTKVTFSTPVHPGGEVPITVTTPGGTVDAPPFTFIDAPTTTGVEPAEGPVAGNTMVTVTGTGFLPGSTVSIDGGDPVTPTNISDDGTTLTFVTPGHDAGDVSITVTGPGGVSNPQTFTYVAVPVATGIAPAQGPIAGGTPVTITGTGFTVDSTVSVDGGPAIVPTNVADDGTTVTFTTPAHALGPVPVTVTNVGGTTVAQTFTYVTAAGPVPVTTAIDPNHGPAAGGTPVTITGSGFTPGSTVTVDGQPAITPTTVSATGTSLTFTTTEHAAGPVLVTVTTPGGTSNAQTFTYDPAVTTTPPVITSPIGGSTVTTDAPPITGTGTPGSTVTVNEGPTVVCTVVVPENGQWSCIPVIHLGNGSHTLTATQTGVDGTSDPSTPVAFTVLVAAAGTGVDTPAASGSHAIATRGGAGTLAYTGSNDVTPGVIVAALLFVLGLGITVAGWRSRRMGR